MFKKLLQDIDGYKANVLKLFDDSYDGVHKIEILKVREFWCILKSILRSNYA